MSSKKREDREARFKQFGENFRAKLIGIDTVPEARGDNMCLGAMSKLKALVKAAGDHKQQIIINVSLEGVKIIDLKSLTNLHTHEVVKISFISRDPGDKRAFGYVYGEAGNHKFFAIKTQNQADELVLALKDLFEIVLANKQKEVEEQKKRMEETTVYLAPSYDNPIGSPTSKTPAENIYTESPSVPTAAAAEPNPPPLASLVSLEDQVSSLQMVSGYNESNVSGSCVYPTVSGLHGHMQLKADDSGPIQALKAAIQNDLAKRFPADAIDVPLISSMLDPRYKELQFLTREQHDNTKKAVIKLLEEVPAPPTKRQRKQAQEEGESSSAYSGMAFLLGGMGATQAADESADQERDEVSPAQEFDDYLLSKGAGLSADPCDWWRVNAARYPSVARIARRMLYIPATSVPSERVFSTAGNIVTAKHNCLTAENTNMLIFLAHNIKFDQA